MHAGPRPGRSDDADRFRERDAMDAALIRLYRSTRDPRRLDRLVERFAPLTRTIASRYARADEPFEDLMQVALLGLVKAIERYEPELGAGFGAFARPTIAGEILRHLRDHTWSLKVPRAGKERWARVADARRHHPDLADPELAGLLGLTIEELRDADRAANAQRAASLDAVAPDAPGPLGDLLGAEDPAFARLEDLDELEGAMRALGPRDREIVRLRFIEDALQREIGEQVGVSQMQVSRVLNRAIGRMRDHLGVHPGPDPSDDPTLPAR